MPSELSRAPLGEATEVVATRVAAARAAQRARYGEDGPGTNAEADATKFDMQAEARALAEQAADRLRTGCGFRRAAIPAPCGWRAALPTWRVPR